MTPTKSVFRIGTRVVNCYLLSNDHGKHGKIVEFKSRVPGWNKIWAWILYDDGTEGSEMKKYLAREDEVVGTVDHKVKS